MKCGEAIFIDYKLQAESRIINAKQPQHCMFEWIYFSRATSKIEGISVNRARGNLGKTIS